MESIAGNVRPRSVAAVAVPVRDGRHAVAGNKLEHDLRHERQRVDGIGRNEHLSLGNRRLDEVEHFIRKEERQHLVERAVPDVARGGPREAVECEDALERVHRDSGTQAAAVGEQKTVVELSRPFEGQAQVATPRQRCGHSDRVEQLVTGIPGLPRGRRVVHRRRHRLPDVPRVRANGIGLPGIDPAVYALLRRRIAAHRLRIHVRVRRHVLPRERDVRLAPAIAH